MNDSGTLLPILLRTVGSIATLVTVLVGVYTAALHALPYQHPDGFSGILGDNTCDTPCVLGVQPGVTTVQEALRILNAHPMVGRVTHDMRRTGRAGEVWWDWHPDYDTLKASGLNVMWHEADGVIRGVSIPTTVPLHEYRVLLGVPDEIWAAHNPMRGEVNVREAYHNVYLAYGYRCIAQVAPAVHRQPITLVVVPDSLERSDYEDAVESRNLFYRDAC